jgi:hypothetical protein
MHNEYPDNSWLPPGQAAEYQLAEQDDVTPVGVTHPDRRAVRGNPPAETAEVQLATEKMYRLAGN